MENIFFDIAKVVVEVLFKKPEKDNIIFVKSLIRNARNSKPNCFYLPLRPIFRRLSTMIPAENTVLSVLECTLTSKLNAINSKLDFIEKIEYDWTDLIFTFKSDLLCQFILTEVYLKESSFGRSEQKFLEKAVIVFDMPRPGQRFEPEFLRSIIHATFLSNSWKFQGIKVDSECRCGIWSYETGYFISEERNNHILILDPGLLISTVLEQKAYPDSLERLCEIMETVRYEDQNIGWDILKRLAEGDILIREVWERIWKIWKNDYQAIFLRMNISLSLANLELIDLSDYEKVKSKLDGVGLLKKSEEHDNEYILKLNEYGLGTIILNENSKLLYLQQFSRMLHIQESYDRSIFVVCQKNQNNLNRCLRVSSLILGSKSKENSTIVYVLNDFVGLTEKFGHLSSPTPVIDKLKSEMLKISIEDRYNGGRKVLQNYDDKITEKYSSLYKSIPELVADLTGISSLFCREMRVKRTKVHEFHWNAVLESRAEPGKFLQYSHARLCGIERKVCPELKTDIDFRLISCIPEALEITVLIGRFPKLLVSMKYHPDSSILSSYLLQLSHLVSSAICKLRIKGTSVDIGCARWLLLWSARQTLQNGMKIMGLNPLTEM
ncbi:Arginyl-tRNA synthetase [Nowakowskiella sp. JEL0078]|nr:Arginyl-tRNA synthetase [Nowakowskiella sp. JEL0078]